MKVILSLITALFVAGGHVQPAHGQSRPPNVVLILADDLGYGDLGVYGQNRFRTPHLDAMAEEGVRFTSFYAGSTVCAPSRWSLLTGTHMGHAYVRGNAAVSLREDEVTLPRVLQQAGYATGMFGKWGLAGGADSGLPHRQGFDDFLGYLGHVHAHSYYTDHLFETRGGRTERVEIDTTQYTQELFVDRALDFIDVHQNEPFFLYLPFALVHAELLVPEADIEPFRNDDGSSRLMPDPPFPCCGVIGTYRGQPTPHAAFAAMVTRLDRDVGRILERLETLGIADDTIVLFTSDNGPHDEGGADPGFFESNGPLRGIKRDLHEGGMRVPMIAWGPGRVPTGEVSDHPWAMWDLFPTVSELTGVVPPETDGLSMANLITGSGPVPTHRTLYWEYVDGWGPDYTQAVRQGDWKLLRTWTPDRHWIELYDLRRDVGEYHDVSTRYPDVVRRLEAAIDEVRDEPEMERFRNPY
ncbi:MAG: arylsulfatase [Rhodothermales bacterium]